MPRSESSEVETGEREVQDQFELSNLSMASYIRCHHELPIYSQLENPFCTSRAMSYQGAPDLHKSGIIPTVQKGNEKENVPEI